MGDAEESGRDPVADYRSWSKEDLARRYELLVAEGRRALEEAIVRLDEAADIFKMTATAPPRPQRAGQVTTYTARLVGVLADMVDDEGWEAREAAEIRES